MKKIVLLFVFIITALGTISLPVHASNDETSCRDVDIIFARGSGQDLGQLEVKRFFEQLDVRLPKLVITKNLYELGTEPYGNYKYPAISVTEWWKDGNAVGAGLSAGLGNDYGDSVDAGIIELQNYLTQRHERCPNARVILGGYSQGAQVVGQTLSGLSSDIQSKIDFVALFGDPKLYLPEGKGISPPACRGLEFSSWRRVIGDCDTDNGSLGARKPYLPETMKDKVGLWCNAEDFVCGSSKNVWKNDGHGEYSDGGGAIDRAVAEIARRLKTTLPPSKALAVDDARIGETSTDIVFLLNRAGWDTRMQYSLARQTISETAQRLREMKHNVRISLRVYSGNETFLFTFSTPLKEDLRDFYGALSSAWSPVEATSPLQPTLRAVKNAFDDTNWKIGASKSVVVITNADFFNPDRLTTLATIGRRSVEIDPVNVFAVVPDSLQGKFGGLAEITSGGVVTMKDDFLETIDDLVDAMTKRPVALLKNMEYAADFNQEITFDASDSYLEGGTITKYEWDFDNDGTFDQTTAAARTSHTYPAMRHTHYIQVRVTGSNGMVANASAAVKISAKPPLTQFDPPAGVTATVLSTDNRKSTIDLHWKPPTIPICGESCSYSPSPITSWVISMNGIVLGTLGKDRVSIQMSDVGRDKDVGLGVSGMSPGGYVSETVTTTVDKLPSAKPEPSISDSPRSQAGVTLGTQEAYSKVALLGTPNEREYRDVVPTKLVDTIGSPGGVTGLLQLPLQTQILGAQTGNVDIQPKQDQPDEVKNTWLVLVFGGIGALLTRSIIKRKMHSDR